MSEAEFKLGYANEGWYNSYYTAQVAPGIGVCVAKMLGAWMVQFFPWEEDRGGLQEHGHHKYVNFITIKAHSIVKEGKNLFQRWPFLQTDSDNTLVLKCIIEDGIRQIGEMNDADKKG